MLPFYPQYSDGTQGSFMLRGFHPLIRLLLLAVFPVAQGTAAAQAMATTEAIPVELLPLRSRNPWTFRAGRRRTRPALAYTWKAQSPEQRDDKAGKSPATDDPLLTMFPHPEGGRFWISGQANIIFQGRLPFHSGYEGPNSFRSSAEYKTSIVGTLYTAVRPTRSIRYNSDLILNLELAAGRGLSQALGLAGFTNLDVVRNPNLGSTPYLARYEIHQVIGLTSQTTTQDANYFSLATSVPVRRIEFRVGKMTLPDFFDINVVGSDSHLQFTNWTVDNNGARDQCRDTRGYTVGGWRSTTTGRSFRTWHLFAMPVVANAHRPGLGFQPRARPEWGTRTAP
jgi:hypothetical protein